MSEAVIFSKNISNGKDPISNSYMLNQLEMESDSNPFNDTSEISEGEIIFDNSFDNSINDSKKRIIKNEEADKILKDLKRNDIRWHLIEYSIRKKDTLWKISKKFKIDIKTLSVINKITMKDILKENDTLLIPVNNGVKYKIKKGDTLNSISRKFDVDIEKIVEHNNIDSSHIIAGKTIFIPDAVIKQTEKKVIAGKKNSKEKQTIANHEIPEKKEQSSKILLAWPLKGPITSGFGFRTHPFSGRKRFHCGLDIGAEIGTPVRAASDGVVIFSGWKGPYGNLIVIQHNNDYITVYAHNSKILVKTDEKIKKGEKIALSGMTGAVTGAHLHFEIRKGIIPLNPSRILK